jgi:hypothetical protein
MLVPLAAVVASGVFAGALATARNVALPRRPAAAGTSATRCAACGAPEHAMLDRRCPAAPRVI